MTVAVAIFEIHIEAAQSLKDKRMVVRSLREKIRNKFPVSIAEVAMQDLHQRARLAISYVTTDEKSAQQLLASVMQFVESNSEAILIGWTEELLDFDESVQLDVPHVAWKGDREFDEEDPENGAGR